MGDPKIGPLRPVPSRQTPLNSPASAQAVEDRLRRAFADREQEIEEISLTNPRLARKMQADLDQLRLSIITAVHDARAQAERRASSAEE